MDLETIQMLSQIKRSINEQTEVLKSIENLLMNTAINTTDNDFKEIIEKLKAM